MTLSCTTNISLRRVMAGGLATGFAGAVMLLCAPGSAETGNATAVKALPVFMPQVIAHRGGAMNRPENTVAAFEHARALGVEIVEFDMEMTADDQIVVYHDTAINSDFCTPRTGATVASGPIRGMTFAQTQQFDCGTGVRPMYAGTAFTPVPGAGIPSLDEALAALRDGTEIVFAETKVPKPAPGVADVDPVKFATMLEAAVRKHGLEDRLILQSFDFRTIDALHKINPGIRTCLLGVPKLTRDYVALLNKHHATCIVLGPPNVDRAGVAALRKAGVLVYSDVVDTPEKWQSYVDLGVDAIFTNDPEGLTAFLKNARLRHADPRQPAQKK